MKTNLLAAALFLLVVTNTFCLYSYYELRADLDQEQGLRDESDQMLREAKADAKANDAAATECAIQTGYKFNCKDGTQSTMCY